MGITTLKRWHWVAIALLLGWLHGVLRQGASGGEGRLDAYDVLLTDPLQFEQALVGTDRGLRRLKDLVIYPYHPDGRAKLHLVTGLYWDGRTETVGGQVQARYVPACFVATIPFRLESPGAPARSFPSVMAYLDSLDGGGVRYGYAWWWWATGPVFTSVCGSLLLIGGLWPALVNLLAFGTLTRPAEAPGLSLWRVHRPPPAAAPPPLAHDADALRRLEQELEQNLARGPDPTSERAPQGTPAAPAVRQLATGDDRDALPAAVSHPDKEFGAQRDDFYPTELHVPSHPHDRPGKTTSAKA